MKLFKKMLAGNTLYYPGCLTKFVAKDFVDKYKKILEREGIDFMMLKEKEFCCGSPVKTAGAEKPFKDLAEKNLKVFKEHGITRIITNCPTCSAVFRNDYPKLLGDKWDIKAQHVSEVIDKSKKFLKKVDGTKATFHDPCHLGRSLGVYDQPREIIKAAGYELLEMELSGKKSFCCGGGGGVKSNNPKLSNSIGEDRVEQARKTKAEVLITNCPMCYMQLKENSGNLKVLEICELFEL